MLPFPSILEQADELDRKASSTTAHTCGVGLTLLEHIATVEHNISAWNACMSASVPSPTIYFNAATSAGRNFSKCSSSRRQAANEKGLIQVYRALDRWFHIS